MRAGAAVKAEALQWSPHLTAGEMTPQRATAALTGPCFNGAPT